MHGTHDTSGTGRNYNHHRNNESKTMQPVTVIPPYVAKTIAGLDLYYPCSGDDLRCAINLFAPFVRNLYFVDFGYFGYGAGADTAKAVLEGVQRYELLDRIVTGSPKAERTDRVAIEIKDGMYLMPVVNSDGLRESRVVPGRLTEVYRDLKKGMEFAVHRCRDEGDLLFQELTGRFGVFFYRGDSDGESGSGLPWLGTEMIEIVLSRLVNGGLLCTDGRNNYGNEAYQFLWSESANIDESIVHSGREFRCLGTTNDRPRHRNRTRIWQVQTATLPPPSSRKR